VLAAHRTVDRARSRAAWTAAELARVTELLDDDFASRADYDVAEATLTAARAEEALARSALAQAQVLLEQAEMNLRQATIVAPVSGVVTARTADVGRMLSASVLDPPLFVIAHDLRRLRLHTSLAESDVPGVRPGSPVAFTVNAYPGRTFEGTVRRVGDEPTTMDGIVTYAAVIDVENPEGRLKPGMTARVSFRPVQDEVLVGAPLGALRL